MRTIRLKEHKGQSEALTPEELRQLGALRPGLLDIGSVSDGLFNLKPRSRVGTIVLPSLRILIRPKVGLRNLFFLLSHASGIRWDDSSFPYEEDDLLLAVAWWFDREVGRTARFGLVRDYVDREETLTMLRGRLAIDRQLASRPGRRTPIECRYQDYSEDTAMNRVLKAAHHALLRLPNLDQELAVRLRHRTRHVFGDVAGVPFEASTLPRVTISRLNQEWETAYRLARMILRRKALRDEHGQTLGESFTVDMNVLFERFVEATVRKRSRGTGYSVEAQARQRLTTAGAAAGNIVVPPINMRPDVLLRRSGKAVAVADAKYKQLLRIGDWEHPDVYQIVTYCVRLGLRQGLLIYAGARPLTESAVIGDGMVVATVGIDLSGRPSHILAQAQAAADALLSQAHCHSESAGAPRAASGG